MRHDNLTLKLRVFLECARAIVMSPQTVETHFSMLKSIIEKHDIKDPSCIFNVDESGFSIRGMAVGRAKSVVESGTKANMLENRFQGTCDHVILMPVVSASRQFLTPLVVLPRKEAKYRKSTNGTFDKPPDFLPKPNYLYMRPIAVADKSYLRIGLLALFREHLFCGAMGRRFCLSSMATGVIFHLRH